MIGTILKILPVNKIVGGLFGLANKKQDHQHETNTELVSASWKDEFWAVIFGLLFIAPIVPAGEAMVKRIFAAFDAWPEDFRLLFISIVVASFGGGMVGKTTKGVHNMKVRKGLRKVVDKAEDIVTGEGDQK